MTSPSNDPLEEAELVAAVAHTAMQEALAKLPVYRGPDPVEAAPIAPDAYEPLYAE
ncbi:MULTISPECIES: hypothetical protein [unclassified Ensifer]|uniref:hypothetical protein n=1 Tax=unclassified Ensifer TaxID=2633371 RepID=UPI00137A716F|nr:MULTISPECIES: hypothetical protein [unclassified Ensifer]